MDIKIIKEYKKHRKKFGVASAECILASFTNNKVDGNCYDVPIRFRKKFVERLKQGSALGKK